VVADIVAETELNPALELLCRLGIDNDRAKAEFLLLAPSVSEVGKGIEPDQSSTKIDAIIQA
jgi:hypothetical protein